MHHGTTGREFILETAAKLFSQTDYKGVSIRDIAQACGMTNAALYYHFKNKDDLYLAVMQFNHDRMMASVAEEVSVAGDLRDRLRRLVNRYASIMCDQHQSFWSMRRDLRHIDDVRAGKLFGGMRTDFMRPLQQLIEDGQARGQIVPGDVTLYARLLHGLIIALTFESKSNRHGKVTPDEIDTVVDVFLNGVSKRLNDVKVNEERMKTI
jgi:AcrR family transcriptional regulator